MKKIFIICFLFLCITSLSYAEVVIHLKSGRAIKGNLVERTDNYITIELYGGNITYWLNDIDKVDIIEPIKEPPKEAPVAAAPKAMQEFPSEPAQPVPAEVKPRKYPFPMLPGIVTNGNAFPPIPVDMEKLKKFMAVAMPILLFFSLLIYIYCALCLQIIAQKTLTPNAWFAWLPIFNFILMCDIAKKPRWWILLFLIPFIGGIIALIISIILWISIAEARNKPTWLGILTIMPIVNFFVMGYLAFSNGKMALPQGNPSNQQGAATP